MTLSQIADLITLRNFVFQVSIPNTKFVQGKTTIEAALTDSADLATYFNKIAERNKAPYLLIKMFTPNGSSYKNRGEQLIFFTNNDAVATDATNKATTATQKPNLSGDEVQNSNTNYQPTKQITNPPKNDGMSDKEYIDYRVLQSEHKRLSETFDEAKSKIKTLEKKVEDLHDENKQLLRDNTTKDDKHALAIDRQKMDAEREIKGSLSGVIGELNENPELIKTIVGFLKPDHPMFKENNQPALEGAEVKELKYHDDADANAILNDIPRMLSQLDGETMAKFYLLFKNFLATPQNLNTAYSQFLATS
jgi:hypothetical protein